MTLGSACCRRAPTSCVRDITVNGLVAGLEPPRARHDIADLVALLDR
jgi:hypothetical protein